MSKRVYLVGHELTLADIMLYYALHPVMLELTVHGKEQLINLSRWFNQVLFHPRRPRGSQSGREKRCDKSFQLRAKEPLGTDSHRTISKNSSRCRLLIGHKKCFVLLCPIGERFLLSSFREFVHDGYCHSTLALFVHQACACKENL